MPESTPDTSPDSLTLDALLRPLLEFRSQRDWEQFHNIKDQAISLTLEAAELLELTQWKNGPELERHLLECREQLEDELADVLGWVLLIAHDRRIDLGQAMARKLEKNRQKYPAEQVRGSARKYSEYSR